ncbi:MAG: class I SAM-dependent methyltransferase [Anaerolineaceae bacterium]|nr:class I SAM-dependent methyltransferase [Anaerolineaceae bacterium]
MESPVFVENILDQALQARLRWREGFFITDRHEQAFRLFNGFLEGCPELVVDIYANTLVLFAYSTDLQQAKVLSERAAAHLLRQLPWVQAVVVKTRNSPVENERRGVLVHGVSPDRKVREGEIWYAVDLQLNLDASLYLDTRCLRAWAVAHLEGKRVLNAFAYTGSLGVAALAGGARQVVQLDLNRRFLNLAQASYTLNGFPIQRQDFISGDFWPQVSRLKRAGELFDCIFIDPPFFSQTNQGRVDLVSHAQTVINKVRPLVGHNGLLVAINNSLFLSGAEYMRQLEDLCSSGYLALEELVPVPPDFTGFPETCSGQPPQDPAPFTHSTKIAVLRVQRKDGRSA